MTGLRAILATITLVVVAYTILVISNHGLGLFQIFFGDIAEMGWPGQFNLDFLGFLSLSALWLAWRNDFTPIGIALGIGGFFLGVPFLCVYLLYVSREANGDFAVLLLGPNRANQRAENR